MERTLNSKYLAINKVGGYWALVAMDKKELHYGDTLRGFILLESAKVEIIDNIIEIEGVQIRAVYLYNYPVEDAHKYVYEPQDVYVKKHWLSRKTYKVLGDKFYELKNKKDFHMTTNIPWSISFSNGEVLSSEELA